MHVNKTFVLRQCFPFGKTIRKTNQYLFLFYAFTYPRWVHTLLLILALCDRYDPPFLTGLRLHPKQHPQPLIPPLSSSSPSEQRSSSKCCLWWVTIVEGSKANIDTTDSFKDHKNIAIHLTKLIHTNRNIAFNHMIIFSSSPNCNFKSGSCFP